MSLKVLPAPEGLLPEPDRFPGAPHPREMLSLVGHAPAEAEVLEAWRAGRMHHAWLITGEEGVGKATLAYRIARFVLSQPRRDAADMEIALSSPVAHQIAGAAHPDLAALRRGWNEKSKAAFTEIRVEDVRKQLDVFNKTAGAGGYRVCIVDACDDLNANSANALLKTLEEPPARSLFLLVAHQPGRLLPTIRSRCRALALRPLSTDEVMAVTMGLPGGEAHDEVAHRSAALRGDGSARRALGLLDAKKLALGDRIDALLGRLPQVDDGEMDALAEAAAGRAGDAAFEMFCDSCERWLSLRLRGGLSGQPIRLSDAWTFLVDGRREVDALNLDRRPFVVSVVEEMARAAR